MVLIVYGMMIIFSCYIVYEKAVILRMMKLIFEKF